MTDRHPDASRAAGAGLFLCGTLMLAVWTLVQPSASARAQALGEAANAVRIVQAWIRWLPAGLPQGGYLTLTNTGSAPITLLSATSASYGEIMLHRSIRQGGAVQMEPVDKLVLMPHQTLDFEAKGYHLMLMQPAASVAGQAKVPITLHFADGSSLSVQFEVRKNTAGGNP